MKIRPLQEKDTTLLQDWITADPDHKETTTPEFFQESGCQSWVFEDEEGEVMVVKLTPAMRVDIQFCTNKADMAPEKRNRVRETMKDGFAIVYSNLKSRGVKEIIFDSTSRSLIAFCRRVLGFTAAKDDYRLHL